MFASVRVFVALAGPPQDPVETEAVETSAAVQDPEPKGGFGSVGPVTTESNIQQPPPEPVSESSRAEPRPEFGGRVGIGYGQTDVRNDQPWDHRGAWLNGALQWYPYVTPRRRTFGIGVELGYTYQGLVRGRLPAQADAPFAKSKVQQHFVNLGLALLVRPHPTWFSIQPTASIGFAIHGGNQLYARNRHAELPGRSNALGVAATLALCTAWDIVCVVGGYRWTDGLDALGVVDVEPFQVPTGTWQVGLGFDILRVYARMNEVPQ